METGQGIVGAQRKESLAVPGTQEGSPGSCGPGRGPQVGTVHVMWPGPGRTMLVMRATGLEIGQWREK